MSVGGEVVGVGQPLELRVDLGVAGGGAVHAQRRGGGRVVLRAPLSVTRPPDRLPGTRRRGPGASASGTESLMPRRYPEAPGVPSITMATIEECRAALERLSDNMQSAEGDVRAAAALDRSLSCQITDLDVTFIGRLTGGRIEVDDTVQGPPAEKAQIRLAMAGDDLVALVDGELNFAKAWGSGRVKLEAGLCDLFRLRKLL